MAERTLFPEWRHQNSPTSYPFADRATLTNAAGRVIPEGTLLDAALYPVGAAVGLFLTQVTVTHEDVTLWVGNINNRLLASGTFALAEANGLIALTDTAGRPAGVLVSESARLAVFQAWGMGIHEFDRAHTEFAATVHFPTPEAGVRGVRLPDGTIMTGDVWLVGSDGVVLRTDDATVPAACGVPVRLDQVIRIDVVGDPLFRRRLCAPRTLFDTPRAIKTVRVVAENGTFDCPPDDHGNLRLMAASDLAADTVLRIGRTPDNIRIWAVGSVTDAGK